MKRVQYDLDFKLNIIQKGQEIGNLSAVARRVLWLSQAYITSKKTLAPCDQQEESLPIMQRNECTTSIA